MKIASVLLAAFAAVSFAHATESIGLTAGDNPVLRPAKIVNVEAVSKTSGTKTVSVSKVVSFASSSTSWSKTVTTNGWTGSVPVIVTNLVPTVTVTRTFVTNSVLPSTSFASVTNIPLSLFVSPGDVIVVGGTASLVRAYAD